MYLRQRTARLPRWILPVYQNASGIVLTGYTRSLPECNTLIAIVCTLYVRLKYEHFTFVTILRS